MPTPLLRRCVAAIVAPTLAATLTVTTVSPAHGQTSNGGTNTADQYTSADESSDRAYESPLSSDADGNPTTSSKVGALLGVTASSWGMIPLIWASMENAYPGSGYELSALPMMALLAVTPPLALSSIVEESSSS